MILRDEDQGMKADMVSEMIPREEDQGMRADMVEEMIFRDVGMTGPKC